MGTLARTLVILTPGFPKDEQDSTCLPAQQIFIKAIKNNFPSLEILVLTFQYPFTNQCYLWNDIRIIPFNGKNKGGLSRLRIWMNVFIQLIKIKKHHNVIGLFSFWCTECALVGKYFSKLFGPKHVTWISGQDAGRQNGFVKFIRPRSNQLAAMSEFLAKEFYNNHSVLPGVVIPNGIDISEFEIPPGSKDIDICAAGSLIRLKQYEIFVEIVQRLKEAVPGINSIICGKGPEEGNLRSAITTLRLEENILLTGEKSHPEVLRLMQRSKVFLHPSSYEGFSSVCMEALYAGAHVISFTDPGFGKIAHWHVVSSNDEMYRKALDILLSADTDYKPVLAYSMDDSAKAVMELFE